MAEARVFKFGTQLGIAKAHHKITRRRKVKHGPGLRKLPKIWGFPFNIYTMAGASDFKFGKQLAKAHHKITPIGKSGHCFGLGQLPYIWVSPLILLQRPRIPLSVSGASCRLTSRFICKITNLHFSHHMKASETT